MSFKATSSIANYRSDVDGLRAVAILAVLWFHAFPETLPGGFVGVDVFFVISGFLITGILLRNTASNTFSFLDFYIRRARRLLPALIIVLPATLAAGWHWLWPAEYAQLGTHAAAAAAFVLNIVLWKEAGYFDVATELKPLMHLWSLGIEEQFYLFYPCLLWLGLRLRCNAGLVIGALVAASFAANLLILAHDPAGAFFLPVSRFWELALGGMLAWWQYRGARTPAPAAYTPTLLRQLVPWFGLLAIVIAAAFYSGTTPYPGFAALLPVIGGMLLIAAGPKTWVSRKVLGNQFMVAIGLISYPLYLWHWPILSFLRIVQSETPSAGMRAAAVGLSIVLAWATYRFVETPLRFGPKRTFRLTAAAAVLCVTAVSAWLVRAESGLPGRVSPDAAALVAYDYDYRSGYREGSCFLRPEQGAGEFTACPDVWPAKDGGWLLWGDSHAAHLYPGMLARFGESAQLVQRTASGCPPLAGEAFPDRPHCPGIQEKVWEEIEVHPPARVTLAARWEFYDWHKLEQTIKRLRAAGVQRIEVVGPVPQWHNGLPRQLAISYRENGFALPPAHLSKGLKLEPFFLDSQMARFASEHGVAYLSPMKALCDDRACLAFNPADPTMLTAWDEAHLTSQGSVLLVANLKATEP